jgi:sugar phosphate isomerase/epimerase
MPLFGKKLIFTHLHDNSGAFDHDEHLIPFDGSIDWSDVAKGIKESEFGGILDVEVTAWALSGDREIRENFGKTIVSRAHRLMEMADLIG